MQIQFIYNHFTGVVSGKIDYKFFLFYNLIVLALLNCSRLHVYWIWSQKYEISWIQYFGMGSCHTDIFKRHKCNQAINRWQNDNNSYVYSDNIYEILVTELHRCLMSQFIRKLVQISFQDLIVGSTTGLEQMHLHW